MKYKSWTVNDIERSLKNIAKKAGISVDGIPVSISKRMSRTMGCCYYIVEDGKIRTTGFKFANCLVDGTYPENVVKEAIIHEYAHHYINTKTNKSQKHNDLFKSTCKMLGISDDVYFKYSEIYKIKSIKYKYIVSCTNCDNMYKLNRLEGGPDKYVKRFVCRNYRGKLKVEKC